MSLLGVFLPLYNQEKALFTQQEAILNASNSSNLSIALMSDCTNDNDEQHATASNIVHEMTLDVINPEELNLVDETSSDMIESSSHENLKGFLLSF